MRTTIVILALSLFCAGAEAGKDGARFGTIRAGGVEFKVHRARFQRRGQPLGGRNLTITSPRFPGARIMLRAKAGDPSQVNILSQGSPAALERMTTALGHRMALPGDAKGAEFRRITSKLPQNTVVPKETVLGRLVAMQLGKKLPRASRRRPARKPTQQVAPIQQGPGEVSAPTVTRTRVTETATRRGAVQGGTVYVDNFTVIKEQGKPGALIKHSDGSSVRLEDWRVRRILSGGPSNSYRGQLRHDLQFR